MRAHLTGSSNVRRLAELEVDSLCSYFSDWSPSWNRAALMGSYFLVHSMCLVGTTVLQTRWDHIYDPSLYTAAVATSSLSPHLPWLPPHLNTALGSAGHPSLLPFFPLNSLLLPQVHLTICLWNLVLFLLYPWPLWIFIKMMLLRTFTDPIIWEQNITTIS